MKFIEPDSKIVWVRSISEVKEIFELKKEFDLIFSDIELLDGNIFDLYEKIKISTPIIFCSAYDHFLLNAFKTNEIAYLLKPYDENQFKEAFNKYELLFDKPQNAKKHITENIIKELQSLSKSARKDFKKRFTIKKNNGVFLLPIDDIVYLQSKGDFIFAFDNKSGKHIINQTLRKTIESIDPDKFFQINRSEIINVDYIEKFESHFKNKISIKMKKIGEPLYTSGSRSPEFRAWVG